MALIFKQFGNWVAYLSCIIFEDSLPNLDELDRLAKDYPAPKKLAEQRNGHELWEAHVIQTIEEVYRQGFVFDFISLRKEKAREENALYLHYKKLFRDSITRELKDRPLPLITQIQQKKRGTKSEKNTLTIATSELSELWTLWATNWPLKKPWKKMP